MKHAFICTIMLSAPFLDWSVSHGQLIHLAMGMSVTFNSQDGSPQGVWIGGRQAIRAVEEGDSYGSTEGGDRQWLANIAS